MSALLDIVTLFLCFAAGFAYEIKPSDGIVYVTKGSTAVQPCVIIGSDFDTGATSVTWEKYMVEDDKTGRYVTSASNVNSPFKETGRYKVLYTTGQLDYSLQITNAKLEDAGKYICDAGNKEKTTFLFVVDPIKSVTIAGAIDTSKNVTFNPTLLEYHTDRDGIFECVASGGNPKPNIALYIEDNKKNVVALFAPLQQVNKTMQGAEVGLQYFEYTMKRYSNSFKLRPEFDGKRLRCVGTVGHGVDDVEASVEVRVIGKPALLPCNKTVWAPLATENFEIKCEFRSRPMYDLTTWNAETSGQSIEKDNSEGGLQAIVTTKNNHYEATLRIEVVTEKSFQDYRFTVTNADGSDTVTIKLERGKDVAEVSRAAVAHHEMALLFLAVSTAWVFH